MKYRIVKIKTGQYKIQTKQLFGWKDFDGYSSPTLRLYCDHLDRVFFPSVKAAIELLKSDYCYELEKNIEIIERGII